MIYRIKELKGDTIPVPQLIFSKLGIAEEYNVRVALYVLATGVTDPEKICADLKLRSRISAESALSFWAGAGPVSYTHLERVFMELRTRHAPVPHSSSISPVRPMTEAFSTSPASVMGTPLLADA